MFLSVLFCTLCFLDPNSRSMPASSTLYHLLPACCYILCYIAVFPPLLIQAKSSNLYSHLLHVGSSYRLPVSSDLLPFLQRTYMHCWKHEMAQSGYLDLWWTEYQRRKTQLAFQMCSPKLVLLLISFWRKSQNRHLKYSQLLWDFPNDVLKPIKDLRGNMSLANMSHPRWERLSSNVSWTASNKSELLIVYSS